MQNWKFQYFLIFWSREYIILHPGKVKTVANNKLYIYFYSKNNNYQADNVVTDSVSLNKQKNNI